MTMDLSIIIVSYNSADFIIPCLTSVMSDDSCEKEVFVVDNRSTDGSVEVIRKRFPEISVIDNHVNRGFAAANNQVLGNCGGRYILFLNPDTETITGSLGRAVSFMDRHADIGLAGTRIINPDGSHQESVSYRYPGEKYAKHCLSGLKGKIACVLGASAIARTELIHAVGGFDEYFFLYGEDQDLALRIRRLGYEIGYVEEATVVHLGAQSERQTPLTTFWERKVWAEHRFYQKHYDARAIRRIMRADLTKALMRILTLRLVLLLIPSDQKSREKLIKYETIRRIIHEVRSKGNNRDPL
jgi:hypothetical protein